MASKPVKWPASTCEICGGVVYLVVEMEPNGMNRTWTEHYCEAKRDTERDYNACR